MYDASSTGAINYMNLASEIISREKTQDKDIEQ
jgi:hypothetical protein